MKSRLTAILPWRPWSGRRAAERRLLALRESPAAAMRDLRERQMMRRRLLDALAEEHRTTAG